MDPSTSPSTLPVADLALLAIIVSITVYISTARLTLMVAKVTIKSSYGAGADKQAEAENDARVVAINKQLPWLTSFIWLLLVLSGVTLFAVTSRMLGWPADVGQICEVLAVCGLTLLVLGFAVFHSTLPGG